MSFDAATVGAAEPSTGARRRAWAAVQRFATNDVLLASLALAALIVIFFYDVVFLGRTVVSSPFAFERIGVTGTSPPYGYPGDPPDYNVYLMDPLPAAWGDESTLVKVSGLLRDLEIPLWDANVALGRPLLGSMVPTVVNPLRLPLTLWPSTGMWDAFLLARLFVAGLFTYLLATRLGLARLAAFGAATAYAFSGFFMLFLNMPHADSAMMVPVLLYSFELLVEKPGPARVAFASVAVALGALTNNPEAAVVLLIYGGGYYLARAWIRSRQVNGMRFWPRVLPLALAGVSGVGLTAFTVVPFIELSGSLGFSGHSVHLHGSGSGRGVESAPLSHLVSVFVPYFHGAPRASFLNGDWTGIRTYVGMAIPVLAITGLWNRDAMGKAGWFFLAAAVLLSAKWYGVPVINRAGQLPVLEQISFGLYLPPAIGFSLAMLAGLGLDQVQRRGWRTWQPLLAAAVAMALLGWLVWVNRDFLDSIPDSHLAVVLTAAIGSIAATAALFLLIRRLSLPAQAGTALLVGLIAAELFVFTVPTKGEFASFGREVYRHLPFIERPQRYDPFTEPPYISFLQRDTSKYRVYGLDRVLHPNVGNAFDIDDVRGYTATTVDRYIEYVKAFIEPRASLRFTGFGWPPLDRQGGASLLADNPMFDLLNVKYIVAPRGLPLAYDYHLAERFLPAEPADGSGGRLDVFTINGDDEAVLFQHPISSLSYTFAPDTESKYLLFRLGMDPIVWRPDRGDGVQFVVSVRENGNEKTLFSRWVDPKNNPDDRRWIDGAVDLSPYLGRTVTLTLSTGPGESGIWDWAGWGGLRLAPSPDAPAADASPPQFRLVFDGDVKVYENLHAFPRAFVVHQAESVAGRVEAAARMREDGFDPASTAVIESALSPQESAALSAAPASDGSSVEITSYEDNEVELLATMEHAGLLVLSDTYYPGWKAYVDGERVPTYPTNMALRSVFVPAGEHEVKFVFSPGSFKLGSALTLASLAALASYAAWGPFRGLQAKLRSRRIGRQGREGASGSRAP